MKGYSMREDILDAGTSVNKRMIDQTRLRNSLICWAIWIVKCSEEDISLWLAIPMISSLVKSHLTSCTWLINRFFYTCSLLIVF